MRNSKGGSQPTRPAAGRALNWPVTKFIGTCQSRRRHSPPPTSPPPTVDMVVAALAILLAADISPPPPKIPLPRFSGANLPYEKIKLTIDPLEYRSASQGAIMPEELEPATEENYDEIEYVIERATRTHGWAPIIPQYKRSAKGAVLSWAWSQWEFTITERLWKVAIGRMLVPVVLLMATHYMDPSLTWWYIPKDHRMARPFAAIASSWNYILTLATFVVTFFVGHSHDFWRKSYSLTRSVQGRCNDIGLLCGSHGKRTPEGSLTNEARALLDDTARNLRLLHCLFYADVCYRKAAHEGRRGVGSIRLLLAFDRVNRIAPGLERLRSRGLITDLEYETLMDTGLPPARWYLIVLEWIAARIGKAQQQGELTGGAGFENLIQNKCCDLRAACMTIPDELAARMPLAYAPPLPYLPWPHGRPYPHPSHLMLRPSSQVRPLYSHSRGCAPPPRALWPVRQPRLVRHSDDGPLHPILPYAHLVAASNSGLSESIMPHSLDRCPDQCYAPTHAAFEPVRTRVDRWPPRALKVLPRSIWQPARLSDRPLRGHQRRLPVGRGERRLSRVAARRAALPVLSGAGLPRASIALLPCRYRCARDAEGSATVGNAVRAQPSTSSRAFSCK